MKWFKVIGFVIVIATGFSVLSALIGIPGEIGGLLGVPVGMWAMLWAADRWQL